MWSAVGLTSCSGEFDPDTVPSVAESDGSRHAMPEVVAELDGFEFYAWVMTAYLLAETTALSLTVN